MRTKGSVPLERREEIVSIYLSGENSYKELGEYYHVEPGTIRMWVSRYRKSGRAVSLPAKSKTQEDMPRKKREAGKTAEVQELEARIRELELQNLALNTLIDVAERNGMEIRKKSGAKQ